MNSRTTRFSQSLVEQRLSEMTAKIANTTELVQQLGVLATQSISSLIQIQSEVEDLYISLEPENDEIEDIDKKESE